MDLEQYYTIIDQYCLELMDDELIPIYEYLERLLDIEDTEFQSLLEFKKMNVTADQKTSILGYLIMGYYLQLQEDDRVACFLIDFDITDRRRILKVKRELERYESDQKIFTNAQGLWDQLRVKKVDFETGKTKYDYELLQFKELSQLDRSEIIKYKQWFLKLSPYFDANILEWCRIEFENSPMFVRLNHNEIYSTRPSQILNEETLVPANPKWWKNLVIYNNMKEQASYFLQNCNPLDDLEKYLEYNSKGIRTLEMIVKRDNSGNLSMMIEELIEKNGALLGRMIHLDTDAKINSDINQAKLNHLDLALNVYTGDARDSRLSESLAFGEKVTNASFRSHLFRIENIPFTSLFNFARMFFKSKILLSEWFKDQFQIEDLN